jgi:hypothetical protein
MRRRRSDVVIGLALALLCLPREAHAQGGTAEDGALFLLLPVGARAVGMGQAIVAGQPGTEAVWWNPAALARAERPEAAIHHSQTIVATGDAVSLAYPSVIGVIVASVNILNYGEQRVTVDPDGSIGTILPRSFVFAGTYASPIGGRVNGGLTFKVVQLRLDCSGECTQVPTFVASTTALDVGAQYEPLARLPLRIGAVVRNVGLRLQVNDEEQADPLPTRLQLGVSYRAYTLSRDSATTAARRPGELAADEIDVDVAGDVVTRTDLGDPSLRVGANVVVNRRVHLRGGYVFDRSEASGPSVGVGVSAGSLSVDIARTFEGFSAEAGQAPVHLSLSYLF